MEGISAGISQILILAIVVVLGFILSKLSYLDEHTSNKLVGILVNVTLPCMIIASTSSVDFPANISANSDCMWTRCFVVCSNGFDFDSSLSLFESFCSYVFMFYLFRHLHSNGIYWGSSNCCGAR